VSVYITFPS